jgi:hypothetical protein
MRMALTPLSRFVVTPTTAKHRVFVWLYPPTLPDHQLIVFARDDDYFFGVLHSRIHEVWSLRTIGRKGVGNDPVYAPTFAFETFPFPWPLNTPDGALTTQQTHLRDAIADAARQLNEERSRWLNPPEWVHSIPGLASTLPDRLVAQDEDSERELRKRTLTNLYNARPAWLDNLHRELDRAVEAAYGWPVDIPDEQILTNLLTLNQDRAPEAA